MGYRRAFFQNRFGILRIVPEAILSDRCFYLRQAFFDAVQVKDSSADVLV